MDRIPLIFRQTSVEEAPAWINATKGCELGRIVQLEEFSLIAAELLLPRPLRTDDLWTLEYDVAWDIATETEHGFARVHNHPVRFHVLQVSFECPPPRAATYFTNPRQFDQIDDAAALHQPIQAGPFLQMALADPVPGLHGFTWTF